MQLLLPTSPKRLPIGHSGVTSLLVTTLTPSSEISQIPCHTCKSLQPDTETADFPQVVDLSGLKQFLMPSFPLHRFTRMGTKDPRKTAHGVIDYRIHSQLWSFEKNNPASVLVKPVPITLVIPALLFAYRTNPTPERKEIANMICVAFFFCICPGEYTETTPDDQAFALNNVILFIGTRRLHNKHSSEPELLAATSLQLTFSTQKNNDRGVIVRPRLF